MHKRHLPNSKQVTSRLQHLANTDTNNTQNMHQCCQKKRKKQVPSHLSLYLTFPYIPVSQGKSLNTSEGFNTKANGHFNGHSNTSNTSMHLFLTRSKSRSRKEARHQSPTSLGEERSNQVKPMLTTESD